MRGRRSSATVKAEPLVLHSRRRFSISIENFTLEGLHEREPGTCIARWLRRRRDMGNLEFPGRAAHHRKRALTGSTERRAVPEGVALSLIRGPVDRAAVHPG